ncbi:MAG TPA: MBL fold metallo-hydrolase [Thermoanaerobaculia bacterium]|nr:MBL fold metallo-hydrolase [Thermoanaerobaculia bacterium]
MKIRSITAPNPGPFTLDGTRTYLLGESAVLDPGPSIESHIEAIREALPKLDTILITHRHGDHAPAAVPLQRLTGARIVAPPGVLDDAPEGALNMPQQRVTGGERLRIEGEDIEVIATPGHTQEHVCYLTQDGDLFSGDTILGSGTTAIFPPDGHMGDYIRSLQLLLTKQPKRIHPAHGPTRDDALPLIEQYLAHRFERERQVLEALANGARTVAEMRRIIYPELDPRLAGAAEIQITAHLIKLGEEGRVHASGGEYRPASAE